MSLSTQLFTDECFTKERLLQAVGEKLLEFCEVNGTPLHSIHDWSSFLERLNGRPPELTVRLPTENNESLASLAPQLSRQLQSAGLAVDLCRLIERGPAVSSSFSFLDEQTERQLVRALEFLPAHLAAAFVVALCCKDGSLFIPVLLGHDSLLFNFLPAIQESARDDTLTDEALLLPLFLCPILAAFLDDSFSSFTAEQRRVVDDLFLQSAASAFTFLGLRCRRSPSPPAALLRAALTLSQYLNRIASQASAHNDQHFSAVQTASRQFHEHLLRLPAIGLACQIHATLQTSVSFSPSSSSSSSSSSSLSSSSSSSAPSSAPVPSTDQDPLTAEITGFRIIEIEDNQYTAGSVSGCGLAAVEVALRMLSCEQPPSERLIREALGISSAYKRDEHLDPEDIIKYVPRYAEHLTIVNDETLLKSNTLFDTIRASEHRHSIIIGLGTTVYLYLDRATEKWVLFDSHSRQSHQGAAFVTSDRLSSLSNEITELFPFTHHQGASLGLQVTDDYVDPANIVRILSLGQLQAASVDDLPSLDLSAMPIHQPEELYPQARQEEDDHAMALRLAQELEEEERREQNARALAQMNQRFVQPRGNWGNGGGHPGYGGHGFGGGYDGGYGGGYGGGRGGFGF